MQLHFEWDPVKAASNLRKHGVSFETATRVLADPNALMQHDRVKDGEERWPAIGVVEGFVMLTVAHVIYEDDQIETIRIISARRADHNERRRYEEANR
jgi:uncharacterized DUF497 family protein